MKGRTRKTLLLLSLSFALVPGAFASEWQHLGTDAKSTHYFYKPKTFAVSKDKIASAWTKKEYNVDLDVMDRNKLSPDEYKGSRSVSAFEEYSCTEKKKRTIIGKAYEGSQESDLVRTDWTGIEPGSIEEGLLSALCGESKPKPAESKAPAKK